MSDLDEYLEFAKTLAEKAGRIMEHYFELEEKGVTIKDDKTPVTLADTEINTLVIDEIKSKFPTHGILGEEESYNLEANNLWVVDPIDGTQNFANKIPEFAFSLALVSAGALKAAVIFDPIEGRQLYATAGGGAYENGKRLNLVVRSLPQKITISSWLVGGIDNSISNDINIAAKVAAIYEQHGNIEVKDLPVAYALAITGAGSVDAAISTIKTPWDVAAGSLIAQEAGAKVTDLLGRPVKDWSKEVHGILAAPPVVHEFLLSIHQELLEGAQ